MSENIQNNQLVVLTQTDLQAMLDNQRLMIEEMIQRSKAPDVTNEGEAIHTITCDGERYITRLDTAKLLGKSLPTLFRYNRDGILKGIKMGPRSVYYRYDDVRALMAGR